METRRWGAVLAVALVAAASALTTVQDGDRRLETPCPPRRPTVSTRPPAPRVTAAEPIADDDARALLAALLLEGARQGWHAR